ncbi:MAG: prepilin-type N-terminal cleavage/methylation domain-containing protein [Gammaproteobacteria bacterium]|nr:prepilin-type N-terminal cleavage/methylation domain-containing protein [Gammaproteobacteria bacterium]
MIEQRFKARTQGFSQGFSLVELMVALSIASIMLLYALPAFNDFTQQRRMTTNVNLMVSAINYARNEAVTQGAVVSVQARDASAAANEWGPGFCVTLGDPGNCDAPLATFTPEIGMTLDGLDGLHNQDTWSFNSTGRLVNGVTLSAANGRVELCGADADDDPGRVMRISATGRASVGENECFP